MQEFPVYIVRALKKVNNWNWQVFASISSLLGSTHILITQCQGWLNEDDRLDELRWPYIGGRGGTIFQVSGQTNCK